MDFVLMFIWLLVCLLGFYHYYHHYYLLDPDDSGLGGSLNWFQ